MWRIAKEGEDGLIVKMCLALNTEDPGEAPVVEENILRTLRTLREEPGRGRVVVLDLNGQVYGYALLISFWSNEYGGEICVVDEFFVEPERRGQGWGTGLLEALATGGGPWGTGVAALSLEVSSENWQARRLFERLDFREQNLTMVRRLR